MNAFMVPVPPEPNVTELTPEEAAELKELARTLRVNDDDGSTVVHYKGEPTT